MGYDRGGDSFPFDFLNQLEFHLCSKDRNRKLSNNDHIPFSVIGNGNIVFSVQLSERLESLSIMGT